MRFNFVQSMEDQICLAKQSNFIVYAQGFSRANFICPILDFHTAQISTETG
jgi:hypothetical protein